MTDKNEDLDEGKSHIPTKETEAEISEVQPPTQPVAVQPLPPKEDSQDLGSADQHKQSDANEITSEVAIAKVIAEPEQEINSALAINDAIEISDAHLQAVIIKYQSKRRDLEIFVGGVRSLLMEHPVLYRNGKCIVHSSKFRLKDPEHLKEKVLRKAAAGKLIDENNLFDTVTDLGGVRILHLFQEDFRYVDSLIRQKVADGDWFLFERAVANTWDPEAKIFFSEFDLEVRQTETLYTSVHYLIKPRADSPLCCEVQVRTLFEEIWGEVDHQINYPKPTNSVSLREQLLVLSKITGAGSRLLDSIRRVNDDGL